MRIAIIIALLVCTCSAGFIRKPTFHQKNDRFGRTYHEANDPFTQTVHTIIDMRRGEFDISQANHLEITKNMLSYMKKAPEPADSDIIQCKPGHPDFCKFAAKPIAKMTEEWKTTIDKESFCFKKTSVMYSREGDDLTVTLTVSGKKSLMCTDSYLVTTGASFHFTTVSMDGIKRMTFKNLKANEWTFIKNSGVEVYRFCDSVFHLLPNVIMTAALFIGGLGDNPKIPFFGSHVPMYMQELNVEFVKRATGYQWLRRKPTYLDYPASKIRSGDFFAITRFDGLDNLIHYGAGSRSGHSVMALWDRTGDKDELYIVESQDAWYWPTHNIQKTKWEDWKVYAQNCDFNVAHLPIRDEYQSKFDETKAWAWFAKTVGMPYGYRNFLLTVLDSPDPTKNVPPALNLDFLYEIFKLLEKVAPALQTDRLLREALSWRLGVLGEGKNLWELQQLAAEKGMNLSELAAIPEQDLIMYSDGYSYVCSSYVASMWKQSGMLDGVEILPSEFTPRDIYMIDVYDKDRVVPAECLKNDPTLPYCQIMGDWLMDMDNYSTIKPYSHMNEKCTSLPPDYIREEGC